MDDYSGYSKFCNKLHDRIVAAIFNDRSKKITKDYAIWRVGGCATGSTDIAFRGNLKSNQKNICEKTLIDVKKKLEDKS